MSERDLKSGLLSYLLDPEVPGPDRLDMAGLIGRIRPCHKHRTHMCTGFCDSVPFIASALEEVGESPPREYLEKTYRLTVPERSSSPSPEETRAMVERESHRRTNLAVQVALSKASRDAMEGKSAKVVLDQAQKKISEIRRTYATERTELPGAEELYIERLARPAGPRLGVDKIDELIEGIEFGTMCTLAGFVGSFKTTWLLNVIYRNAVDPEKRLNGVFLTLEIPREILLYQFISRHSYDPKFSEYHPPIPYSDVLKRRITPGSDSWNFFFKVVEKDLFDNPEYGSITVVEQKNLHSITMRGIREFLLSLDTPTHVLGIDYAQLTRYLAEAGRVGDIVSIDIFIRRFAEFLKDFERGTVAGIVAAQTNRQGWERAAASGGRYELSALSEARELERSSRYVCFSFADDTMIAQSLAKVSLHKQNLGRVHPEPIEVATQPMFAVFGTDEVVGKSATNFADIFNVGISGP